jgi:hypothetical protein
MEEQSLLRKTRSAAASEPSGSTSIEAGAAEKPSPQTLAIDTDEQNGKTKIKVKVEVDEDDMENNRASRKTTKHKQRLHRKPHDQLEQLAFKAKSQRPSFFTKALFGEEIIQPNLSLTGAKLDLSGGVDDFQVSRVTKIVEPKEPLDSSIAKKKSKPAQFNSVSMDTPQTVHIHAEVDEGLGVESTPVAMVDTTIDEASGNKVELSTKTGTEGNGYYDSCMNSCIPLV